MKTTAFKLRPWKEDDIISLAENANDPEIAKFLTDAFPHPYTAEHARKFIEISAGHYPQRIFAIEVEGMAAGGIGIHPQTDIMSKNAEIGYWLGRKFHGLGIISRAIPQIVEYGFRTFDINRIYARPFGNNMASQRALEKCGFKLEARISNCIYKNGEYLDELIYAIRRENQ